MAGRNKRRKRQHQKEKAKVSGGTRPENLSPQELLAQARTFIQKDDTSYATKLLKQAIDKSPDNADAHYMLGVLYVKALRANDAIGHLETAHNLEPDNIHFLTNLADACRKLRLWDKAETYIKKLVAKLPKSHNLYHNLACTQVNNSKFDDALDNFNKAMQFDETCVETLATLGITYVAHGQFQKAREICQKALAIQPQSPLALWNMAHIQMICLGQWDEALPLYNKGFELGKRTPKRNFEAPLWDGKTSLKGKRLLVWREQGIGDEMRFYAHLQDFVDMPKTCLVECEERLVPTVSRSFKSARVMAEIDPRKNKTYDRLRTDIDFHVPLGTLRYYSYLKHGKMQLPDKYLKAESARTKYWKQQIDKCGTGLKVGICWRSHKRSTDRREDYSKIEDWHTLLKVPGVTFINLQYDQCDDELAKAKQNTGVTIHQMEGISLKNDIDESFALTEALDLVITAPTATCEIAAALGKAAWKIEAFGPASIPLQFVKHPFDQNSVVRMDKPLHTPWKDVLDKIAQTLHTYIETGQITVKPYNF